MGIVFIIAICSSLSHIWVHELTQENGLFSWLPKYYPTKLYPKPLGCDICISGWLAVIVCFCVLDWEVLSLYKGLGTVAITMVVAKLIRTVTNGQY